MKKIPYFPEVFEDFEHAKITAINRLTGKVTLFVRNGLVSAGNYLYDLNELREGMNVLVGRVSNTFVILNKVNNVPRGGTYFAVLEQKRLQRICVDIDYVGEGQDTILSGSWHGNQVKIGLDLSIHLVYCKTDWGGTNSQLVHAVSYDDGLTWTKTVIDPACNYTGNFMTALDANSKCHVMYRRYPSQTILYANNVSGSWATPVDIGLTTFLGVSLSTGAMENLCVGTDGSLHCIIRVSANPIYLKYARYSSGSWELMRSSGTANDVYLIQQNNSWMTLIYYSYPVKMFYFREDASIGTFLASERAFPSGITYGSTNDTGCTLAEGRPTITNARNGGNKLWVYYGEDDHAEEIITTPCIYRLGSGEIYDYSFGLTVWGDSYFTIYDIYSDPDELIHDAVLIHTRGSYILPVADNRTVYDENYQGMWHCPYTDPGYYKVGGGKSIYKCCSALFYDPDYGKNGYGYRGVAFVGYKYVRVRG
jgi:hypothetical protein